jgi:hypothetical protein
MVKIDTRKYEEQHGNPALYSKGIRWFLVDGVKVQIFAPSWKQAQDLVIRLHPSATSIELLP